MFSLFKRKPYLRDLIPSNYVDIHSHILPGIDDGAVTLDDTQRLLSKLSSYGFKKFIATPHVMNNVWENSSAAIEEKLNQTTSALAVANTSYSINAAAEYLMDDTFVKLFQTEKLRTLKDNYVLVEMSYINPPIQLYQILFDLQVAGYQPVLAHPERYAFYHGNFAEYQKLKNAGCYFQMNVLSAVGYYGPEVAAAANKLLQSGMIDFAGSDVHHENHLLGFEKRLIIKNDALLSAALNNNVIFG